MKKIAVLGSTGSIGTQTLEVVRANKDIEITALTCGGNIEILEQQILEFKPEIAAVMNADKAFQLEKNIKGRSHTKILSGIDGIIEAAASTEASIVVTAVVGMIGIRPTIAAIKAGKDIALANKETLVCAGHIIMPLAKEHGVKILPVDSEHSAIFQSLNGESGNKIDKILLTASGGPFRGRKKEELVNIRPCDALKHPNWTMGRKITIDSSTMVNKGLEMMEAAWLFGVDLDRVQVTVQPKSVIHSAVQFEDGAIIAQLGTPDMKLPIQYALYFPERRFLAGERLDLFELGSITFEKPDPVNFKGLALAYRAGKTGGTMPTVYNAANEMAVAAFLDEKIGYLDIADTIEECMNAHTLTKNPDVSRILEVEQETYDLIRSHMHK